MSGTSTEVDGRRAEQPEIEETLRYRLLASDRRRIALRIIAERGEPVDLDDLATAVARRERPGDDVEDGTETRVRISMHHVHVPKLAAAGVCTYDRDGSRVVADKAAVDRLLDGQ